MQERSVAETQLSLRFLGVGNARASELGSASAVLEFADEPGLLIDCGPRTLDDFRANYERELPPAVFISHLHLDHIGGIEQLFYRAYFTQRGAIKLFVPADLVAALHAKLANAPFILSEGGANFWDAFRLIPVGDWFWYEGLLFQVFPVRHSGHRAAFGVALGGSFLFSSDTRPILEVVQEFAACGETVFHDCGLHASPAHAGLPDILREYPAEIRGRLVAYHYESEEAGKAIEAAGLRVARPGQRFSLTAPLGAVELVVAATDRADRNRVGAPLSP
jgi:ribonuclease BN (tRNA processing enzyme)